MTFGLKAAGWLVAVLDARAAAARPRAARRAARRRGGHARGARRRRAARCSPSWRGARARRARRCPGTRRAGGSASWPARSASRPARSARWRRHHAAGADRGRRGRRGRRRRLVGHAAQAQPGRAPCARGLRAAGRRGLVATLLAAMAQEHERAAGAWQAEWRPLRAAARRHRRRGGLALRETLEGLEVDADAHARERVARRGGCVDERPEAPGAAGVFVDRALGARTAKDGLAAPSRCTASRGRRTAARARSTRSARPSRCGTPQADALAERCRLVRYDHRGHGGSPAPAGPYSIADLGGDVLALLDRLEIERASLCGLSLGGMTAMWLASDAPERVERLVLCCTSALLGPASGLARARARPCAGGASAAIADAVLARWFTPGVPRAPAAGRGPASSAMLARHARRGLRRLLRGDRATWTCARPLGAITAPDARDRRRRGPRDAARARRSAIAGGDPRRAARDASRTPPTWPTSSSPRPSPTLILEHLDHDRPTTTRHEGPPRGARRRARRPRDRATRPTSPRRFQELITRYAWGEVWTRPGPRPPHAQRHHARGAGRARPRERDRDARPRRAAQRPHARRRSARCCCTPRSTAACRRPTRRSRSRSRCWTSSRYSVRACSPRCRRPSPRTVP